MRHRKAFNHLSRTSAHRKAMMANMASSLILHKRIRTTTAKAKALRTYVEPLITKSKDDSTHSRRVVFSYLQDKNAVSELFREISPKIMDRPGGYTRILKIGNRLGDNADMCIIELVDYNENLLETQEAAKTKSSRRRRGKKKSSDQAPAVEAVEESVEDQPETGVKDEAPAAVKEEKTKDTVDQNMPDDAESERSEEPAKDPEALKTTEKQTDKAPTTGEKTGENAENREKEAAKPGPGTDYSVEAKSSPEDKVEPAKQVKEETETQEKGDKSSGKEDQENQEKK